VYLIAKWVFIKLKSNVLNVVKDVPIAKILCHVILAQMDISYTNHIAINNALKVQ
jgi:hypothetical protein